jgi:hypothetical protein
VAPERVGAGGRDLFPRRAARLWQAVAVALAATLSHAHAQTTAKPVVIVPASIAAEPASQTIFRLRVEPANAVPKNSFVRVRGLPPMAALSEGHSIGPGAWAISLAALADLKITVPAGAAGRTDIVVTLVAIDGAVLAEAMSTLAVSTGAKVEKGQASRDTAPPVVANMLRAGVPESTERSAAPSQPVTQAMTPQDRERALRLVKKGDEQLAEGNVAAARLFYERAADAGLAQGAMALAGTFDTSELARLGRARHPARHEGSPALVRARAAARRQGRRGTLGAARGHLTALGSVRLGLLNCPPPPIPPRRQRVPPTRDVGHGIEPMGAPGMAAAYAR